MHLKATGGARLCRSRILETLSPATMQSGGFPSYGQDAAGLFQVGFQLLGPRDRIYAGIDGTSPGSYASFTKKPKSTCPVDNPAIPQSVPDV